jgi:hypothetical protein
MEATREQSLAGKLKGLALLIGPGLILLGDLVEPNVDWEDQGAVLDSLAADTGRHRLAIVLFYLGFLLLIPGAIAAARYFRRERPGLSLAATLLAPLVPILITGFIMFGMVQEAFVDPAADRAEMVALMERMEEVALFPFVFGVMMVGLLGMLLLAIGLWRSKTVPIWVPALIVVGFVVVWFAPGDVPVLTALGNVILWAGFGAIGLKILSEAREGAVHARETAPV